MARTRPALIQRDRLSASGH